MKKIILLSLSFVLIGMGAEAQKINGKAPDFSGISPDGKTVRLSDFSGKVLLLDFWASWCGPCKQEMPFLVELYSANKDRGFAVLGVNVDKEAKNLEKFLSGLAVKPEFPIIHDPQSRICPLYGLEGMPTSVLIDRKGIVRYRHVGFKPGTGEELLKEISALIGEK